jgi:hypothetical protein
VLGRGIAHVSTFQTHWRVLTDSAVKGVRRYQDYWGCLALRIERNCLSGLHNAIARFSRAGGGAQARIEPADTCSINFANYLYSVLVVMYVYRVSSSMNVSISWGELGQQICSLRLLIYILIESSQIESSVTVLICIQIESSQIGARGNVLVKALCYKQEGRGFETRWGKLIFSFTWPCGRTDRLLFIPWNILYALNGVQYMCHVPIYVRYFVFISALVSTQRPFQWVPMLCSISPISLPSFHVALLSAFSRTRCTWRGAETNHRVMYIQARFHWGSGANNESWVCDCTVCALHARR